MNNHNHMNRKAKRMPEDVVDAFCDVFMKQGSLSEQEARALIVTLKRTGRYQQECWD
jgi:sulfite reductase alpha subunit-like flavoprotein